MLSGELALKNITITIIIFYQLMSDFSNVVSVFAYLEMRKILKANHIYADDVIIKL